MSDPAANFATPRISAGALFVNGDRVLLVHKTYGNGWDIQAHTSTQANHQPRPAAEN